MAVNGTLFCSSQIHHRLPLFPSESSLDCHGHGAGRSWSPPLCRPTGPHPGLALVPVHPKNRSLGRVSFIQVGNSLGVYMLVRKSID